ncbi:uncharacterized protein LOC111388319 [Olea europaea var. sylvestris]|uniref:uncharacterized protein LOC111388319 n=1 Tax=Olea europaea var. sylvestris TaxID=158386 RepID=UPI000C1D8542|nr:uncharacterized protein LOC111388319 [Olea europaea var. sylvestris]
MQDCIFISQAWYAKEILKKFNMEDCKPVCIPVECETKLSKNDEGKKVDPTLFKSLVEILRYLMCTRSDIFFWSWAHQLLYGDTYRDPYESCKEDSSLHQSDWGGDSDDRKSMTGYVFYLGDIVFTWSSKWQSIIALSIGEVEYVVPTSSEQIANIITKPLKHYVLHKLRTLLGVVKSSFRGDVES